MPWHVFARIKSRFHDPEKLFHPGNFLREPKLLEGKDQVIDQPDYDITV